MMVQPQRRQVFEQPRAKVVDHPLPGVDLHLRPVGRHELVDHLQHDAGDHDRDEERELVVRRERRDPRRDARERLGERPRAEEVDHHRERPGLERAEADLRHEQERQQRDALPVGPQVRQRPHDQAVVLAVRHPPTLRVAGVGRGGGTSSGAIRGMIRGTILSSLESAT